MTRLLPGDVAVVTGAARGIGLGLAHAFATRGLRVVLADVDAGELETARAEVAASGADVVAIPTDVASEEAVFSLAEAALAHFGSVDVVCNNAGVGNDLSPCWDKSREAFEKIISINLLSVVHGIRAFVPHLVAQGSGHVLNTSSMSGLRSGSADMGDYAMTKAAVVALTESLHEDLRTAAPGVGATVLCPGFIRTPLAAQQAEKLNRKLNRDDDVSAQWGTPFEPAFAAEVALKAIESNLLYAAPAHNAMDSIAARFDRLREEISALR